MRTQTHCSAALRALLSLLVLTVLHGCSSSSGYVSNRTGMAYYRRGNYHAARDAFRRASIDSPQNVDYLHNLAASLKRQGNIVGAEQAYRQALNIDPAHQPSYHGMAMLLHEQKRGDEADELLDTWAGAQPYSAAAHIETAWLKRERGDFVASESSLKQALKAQPNHSVALAQLGQLYEQTGQQDRAVAMYQRSLYSHWNQPGVQRRLAANRRRQPFRSPSRYVQGSVAYGPRTRFSAPHYAVSRTELGYPQSTFGNAYPNGTFGPPPTLAAQPQFAPEFSGSANADPAHIQ